MCKYKSITIPLATRVFARKSKEKPWKRINLHVILKANLGVTHKNTKHTHVAACIFLGKH